MKRGIFTKFRFATAVMAISYLTCIYMHGSPIAAASTDLGIKEYVTIAANGEKIPNPTIGRTYEVKTGTATVTVPEGMVYIPAGSFIMGTQNTAHRVTLSAYCIGKFEVTNAEFNVFCKEMGKEYRPAYWGSTDPEIEEFLTRRGTTRCSESAIRPAWLTVRGSVARRGGMSPYPVKPNGNGLLGGRRPMDRNIPTLGEI